MSRISTNVLKLIVSVLQWLAAAALKGPRVYADGRGRQPSVDTGMREYIEDGNSLRASTPQIPVEPKTYKRAEAQHINRSIALNEQQ
uniref:Secreted protein n=1 Tax=Ascaris lumbricoides TaxID=6252 RepID=A0A0M3IDK7_ASCLU